MWRHFSSRSTFLFSLHSSVRSSHLSSSSTYSSIAPSLSRRLQEESRNVKVGVWWDFDTCKLPTGVNVLKVAPIITAALKANGIKGPIEITAFGSIWNVSKENPEAIMRTGIDFYHVPKKDPIFFRFYFGAAQEDLVCQRIHSSLVDWICENPPPTHLFFITRDTDLTSTLQRLRMRNYNILVASTGGAMDILCTAATITWHWKSLVMGEKLIGIRRNVPPDGFNDSWYGHFEAPLEDSVSNFQNPYKLEEASE